MPLNGAFYRAYYIGMNHAESILQKGTFDQLCLLAKQNWLN